MNCLSFWKVISTNPEWQIKRNVSGTENKDPFDLDENAFIKEYRFFNKFGIPGVIGCIDCTHVRTVRPNEHEDRYFCRKKFHSLNVQLICDADQQILSVDASHPGSLHDSFIWSHHPVTWVLTMKNDDDTYFGCRTRHTGSILYTKACKG
ncbi:putative nuclease HARBI1 isoform X1 [Amyelois transitella]|uniref:putative nuclease HARBI1 isoform X1 n=1 Tax=Amyelois transitella TaxID=680683 RepID=UPI00298F93BC|nr:putative nuclease HARBI1 isoform X1 [Amyelois transitella]